jgi:hypothetical protein
MTFREAKLTLVRPGLPGRSLWRSLVGRTVCLRLSAAKKKCMYGCLGKLVAESSDGSGVLAPVFLNSYK